MSGLQNPADQVARVRSEKGLERLRDEYLDVLFQDPGQLPDGDQLVRALGFPSAASLLPETAEKERTQAQRSRQGKPPSAVRKSEPAASQAAAVPPQRVGYLSMVEKMLKDNSARRAGAPAA